MYIRCKFDKTIDLGKIFIQLDKETFLKEEQV